MKIQNVGGHGGPQRPDGRDNAAERPGPPSSKRVERDSIELSESARERLALIEAAKELPEIREERVSILKRAIDSGSYEVDPRRLAHAILELEDDLNR